MPTKTKIEWTDYTSNPIRYRAADGRVVWACEKVSAGCQHCYAEALSRRYTHLRAGDWNAATMATLTPFLDEKEVRALLHMKSLAGKRVFIGDMTDVFGEWVPDEMLDRLFAVFALRPDVTFQLLTKRAKRMREFVSQANISTMAPLGQAIDAASGELPHAWRLFSWPLPNVWLGVSAEDQQRADERIPDLLATPAAVRFVSAEPLLGPLNLREMVGRDGWYMDALDILNPTFRLQWVIVGGESGPGARPCDVAWIRSIVEQCQGAAVPVFVKQLGSAPIWRLANSTQANSGYPASSARACGGIRHLKGGDPAEWPDDLRVRQFPVTEGQSSWRG